MAGATFAVGALRRLGEPNWGAGKTVEESITVLRYQVVVELIEALDNAGNEEGI